MWVMILQINFSIWFQCSNRVSILIAIQRENMNPDFTLLLCGIGHIRLLSIPGLSIQILRVTH